MYVPIHYHVLKLYYITISIKDFSVLIYMLTTVVHIFYIIKVLAQQYIYLYMLAKAGQTAGPN